MPSGLEWVRGLLVCASVLGVASGAMACGGGADPDPVTTPVAPPVEGTNAPAPSSETPSGNVVPTVAPAPVTELAPYVFTWGFGDGQYPFRTLAELQSKTNTPAVTLAFVTANGGCEPTHEVAGQRDDIDAFVAAGGHVKASFGGESGAYLENACDDAASLAKAIVSFVDETGVTDLDFDVEQAPAMNAKIDRMRGEAFRLVQSQRAVKISLTLPTEPEGLSDSALAVVKGALDAGVTPSHVNLMTMNYGTSKSAGHAMSELAIASLTGAAAQLQALIPSLTNDQAMQMLGATPMIGKNDIAGEVFTLADAKALVQFAKERHVGLVAFWAIQRDQACSGGGLGTCSGVQSSDFAFQQVFASVR